MFILYVFAAYFILSIGIIIYTKREHIFWMKYSVKELLIKLNEAHADKDYQTIKRIQSHFNFRGLNNNPHDNC